MAVQAEVSSREPRSMLSAMWGEIRSPMAALVVDLAFSLLVLASLSVFHLVLDKVPYPALRKQVFEDLHYYAYVIVWTIFLIDLILKMAAFVFRRRAEAW